MTPAMKRTILHCEATGRRYFIVRTSSRPQGRRYFVCANPECTSRVLREADVYCRLHSREQELDVSMQSDRTENLSNEIIDEEPDQLQIKTKVENLDTSSTSNRDFPIDLINGARCYRDHTGRRRYICMQSPCRTILKRQSDIYCRSHLPATENEKKESRRSVSLDHSQTSSSLMEPTTSEDLDNVHQSDEPTPIKDSSKPQRPGTHRSFRDASGKIRFLCSIPTCTSRVARQTDYYCRRHQIESQSNTSNLDSNETKPKIETNGHRESTSESAAKKRKVENLNNKRQIVIATTTLQEDQWNDVIKFLRHFPDVQFSTNLNINNSTTHLLVDDRETHLHCTITKKIVQAAVRRHIFILSIRWLNECLKVNRFVDEHPYEIRTDSHTALRLSAQQFSNTNQFIFPADSPYLYAFAIECRQCQGSINRSELIELIHLTGAQLFENEQAVDILIVLCDTNEKNLSKLKEKYAEAPASSIKFVTSDFLLKSIIKFELQDLDKYSL